MLNFGHCTLSRKLAHSVLLTKNAKYKAVHMNLITWSFSRKRYLYIHVRADLWPRSSNEPSKIPTHTHPLLVRYPFILTHCSHRYISPPHYNVLSALMYTCSSAERGIPWLAQTSIVLMLQLGFPQANSNCS